MKRNSLAQNDGPAPGATSDMRVVTANSLAVGTWTVLGRATGLCRAVAIAAVLGPTYFGNLFQATNTIPNLLYEFLAGNLIVSLLVPPLVRRADASDREGAARLACQFLAVLLTVFAVIAVITIAAGPYLIDFLTFGVDDATVRAEQRSAGWILLFLLVPQVLLYAIAGVGMAAQHAAGRYRLATAAFACENVGVIAVVIASGFLFGTGVSIGDATTAHLVFLGAGTTSAVALHAVTQWWGAWRVGIFLRPRLGWRDEELRQVLNLGFLSLGHAGLNALRLITLIAVAGSVPGGVVAFQMALSFFYLPVAVGARPMAWAMVPHLARLHQRGSPDAFRLEWARGLSMSLFAVIPAVAAYLALAHSLARVVSLGEMATTTGVTMVSASLLALAPGILGETMFLHASHASYARSDAKGPLRAMTLRVAVTFVGVVATVLFTSGKWMLVGLGITVAIADIIGGGYLSLRIARGAAGVKARLRTSVGHALAATLVMTAPVYLIGGWRIAPGATQLGVALPVLLAAVIGFAIYVGMQRLVFNASELELYASQFGGIFRRSGR